MVLLIIGICINLLLSHIVGKSGKKREIGYGVSFMLSFLLSPIIGLLFVIASLPKKEDFISTEVNLIPKLEKEIKIEMTTEDKRDIKNRIIFLVIFIVVLLLIKTLKL